MFQTTRLALGASALAALAACVSAPPDLRTGVTDPTLSIECPDVTRLHAAKGLEWPHVILAGVVEGLLPFRPDEDADSAQRAARIEEERRLMYVGITRARTSLAVSWTRRRKRGREIVAAQPSRFIAEMALEQTTVREDPREKLKALRAEFARRAAAQAADTATPPTPG